MTEFSGAGFGLRRPHLAALLDRSDRAPAVVELTPSHYFASPAPLERIGEGRAIVLHDVFASLATVGPLDRDHLARVAEVARRSGARLYSEHIAMTRSPAGLELGHLIPVARTRAQLDVLVDHVREVSDLLGLPVALELPTTTLDLSGLPGTMPEGEWLHALVERGGCELVLDVENLRVDAANFAGLAVGPRLASWPLHAVSHVQLAGGERVAGWHVDSHAAPVPEPTWGLLAWLRGRIEPRTIIVERDAALPEIDDLLGEARRAEAIWRGDIAASR